MHDAITLNDMFGMVFFTIVVCAIAGTISGFLAYEAGFYTGYSKGLTQPCQCGCCDNDNNEDK